MLRVRPIYALMPIVLGSCSPGPVTASKATKIHFCFLHSAGNLASRLMLLNAGKNIKKDRVPGIPQINQ